MCTSNIADNTQRLVSIGKVHRMGYGGYQCNGKNHDIPQYQDDVEVTVSCLQWCQNCRMVVDDDESVEKMGGSDVDVEPFLVS